MEKFHATRIRSQQFDDSIEIPFIEWTKPTEFVAGNVPSGL